MLEPSLIILFVKNPLESAKFYESILEVKPIEQSPTFVMFGLPNNICLGLWSDKTAKPTVTGAPGSSEIVFSRDNVDEMYDRWRQLGITILEEPVHMEGGYSFVAQDPDGHRLRICRLHGEAK